MAGIIFSEGSGLNNSAFGKSQEPIKAVIEQNVEAFEEMSMIDKIFYMDKSTNFAENIPRKHHWETLKTSEKTAHIPLHLFRRVMKK